MEKKKGGHAGMPREKWEKNDGQLGKSCDLKYAGEFSNPEDLKKSTDALAAYVKKNRTKY